MKGYLYVRDVDGFLSGNDQSMSVFNQEVHEIFQQQDDYILVDVIDVDYEVIANKLRQSNQDKAA